MNSVIFQRAGVIIGAICRILEVGPQKTSRKEEPQSSKEAKQRLKYTREKIFCQRKTQTTDLYTDRNNQQTGHSCGDCKLKIGVYMTGQRSTASTQEEPRLQTTTYKTKKKQSTTTILEPYDQHRNEKEMTCD